MIPEAITADPVSAVSPLLQRCAELGLPVWRLDAHGNVLRAPDEPGVLGVWLRSGAIVRKITQHLSQWSDQSEPQIAELFPGCWLLPIPETRRRRVLGFTVAMALTPLAAEDPHFRDLCIAAAVDPSATRTIVTQRATFSRVECERLLKLLNWTADDLTRFAKGQTSVETLTTQLSDAYETISTLYGVGQKMNTLTEPGEFVRGLLEETRQTLNFAWTAAWMSVPGQFADTPLFVSGETGCDEQALVETLRAMINRASPDEVHIASVDDGLPEALGPQLIGHLLTRDAHTVGLVAAGHKLGLDPQVSSYETLMLQASAGFLSAFIDNVELYAEQNQTFMGTIQAMTAAIDAKDRYTRGHSERVAHLSAAIAHAAGLDEAFIERVYLSGLVHDIGKIGVPERVLCKPGRLTDEEFALIRLHPEIGHRILAKIPALDDLLPGVLHHHERWDGRGYPHNLAGDHIPLMARLIGLADTFDAMSSTRSYRPAMEREKVLNEIRRCAGTQFDPELAEHFFKVDLAEYDRMVADHASADADVFKLAA